MTAVMIYLFHHFAVRFVCLLLVINLVNDPGRFLVLIQHQKKPARSLTLRRSNINRHTQTKNGNQFSILITATPEGGQLFQKVQLFQLINRCGLLVDNIALPLILSSRGGPFFGLLLDNDLSRSLI